MSGPGRPRRIDADGSATKDKEAGDCSSHCRVDEANVEPRGNSPLTSDDKGDMTRRTMSNRPMTNRHGPCGAGKEEHQEMSDSATSRLSLLSRMPRPAANVEEGARHAVSRLHSEDGNGVVLGSGEGRGKMMPPSPAMKRWREDDVFSPSIYPRLTALKLVSPCNKSSPSPALAGFRDYHTVSTPLLNRSSPGSGEGKIGREQDPSLLLPPLALPQSASLNTQVCLSLPAPAYVLARSQPKGEKSP